jgi:predicted tellurium resistance membrane protein TerC
MFDIFLNPDAWIALLTLTFLEIVLGIDNIIFISIAAGKLEEKDRVKATNIGLVLAMLLRVGLLFGISLLTALNQPFLEIDTKWVQGNISGQAIILFLGGLFLLYKSTKEIHQKVEDWSI